MNTHTQQPVRLRDATKDATLAFMGNTQTKTKTTKMVRWKCDTCGSGCLAPSRPRMDDARRYCLPCTEATGRLVKRVAPTLERKRVARTEARKASDKRKRATVQAKTQTKKRIQQAAKRTHEGIAIAPEAKRLWRLLEPYHKGAPLPAVEVSTRGVYEADGLLWSRGGGYAGLAYLGEGRIWLKAGCEWGTLAHELVHMAVGTRRTATGRRCSHDKVFYYALKDLAERRWKVPISYYGVTQWGYTVDRLLRRQLREAGVFAK